jgi:hypothetical protein
MKKKDALKLGLRRLWITYHDVHLIASIFSSPENWSPRPQLTQ